MTAKDLMSSPVVTVTSGATIAEIVDLLLDRHIGGVPVLSAGRVVGLIGRGELLNRYEIGTDGPPPAKSWWDHLLGRDPGPSAYIRTHAAHAADIMSTDITTVLEDASIAMIAAIFDSRRIRRLPVMRGEELVGIVTRTDLIRALAEKTHERSPEPVQTDDVILHRLCAELERQPWWRPLWSTVVVSNGVVRFQGICNGDDDRQAARIAAENTWGVRSVKDDRIHVSEWQPMV
jgi:CBS domain-containing protein